MDYKIFPLLSGNSRKSFMRRRKRWGHEHRYVPREPLMSRLCHHLGMSKSQIVDQIAEERKHYFQTGQIPVDLSSTFRK